MSEALRAFWDRLAPPVAWCSYPGAEPFRDMVLWPLRMRVALDFWPHVRAVMPDSHAVAYYEADRNVLMIYARPIHLLARLWHRRAWAVFGTLMALGVWEVPEFGYIVHDGRWRWDFWRNARRYSWREVWRIVTTP